MNNELTSPSQNNTILLPILQMAVRSAINTCILGAGNKFDDIKRSNGWSFATGMRNTSGEYSKEFDWKHCKYIYSFSSEKNLFNVEPKENSWYYHPKTSSDRISIEPFGDEIPLGDPIFNLSERAKGMLALCLVARALRRGNCAMRAALVVKYLWEHATDEIKRIEFVELVNEDHAFVIVNREGNDLENPHTWGKNCWVVDAWWTSTGKIYPASEFEEQLINYRKYATKQENRINQMGINSAPPRPVVSDNWLGCYVEIVPDKNRYPTYDKYKTIDDYYFLKSDDSKEFQTYKFLYEEEHRLQFAPCLEQVKTGPTFFKSNKQKSEHINSESQHGIGQTNTKL